MGYILDSIKALFTKNTTNAASVSGARVPIMSSDGTPIGNDSLANLASVLGVVKLTQEDYRNDDTSPIQSWCWKWKLSVNSDNYIEFRMQRYGETLYYRVVWLGNIQNWRQVSIV